MADYPPSYAAAESMHAKSTAPPDPTVVVETVHYQYQATTNTLPYPQHTMGHSMSAGSVTTAAFPAHPQPSQPTYAPAQPAMSDAKYQYPPYAVQPGQAPHPSQYPYPPGHFSAPTGYPPQQQMPIQYIMAPPQQAPAAPAQPNFIVLNNTTQQQQTTAATRTVFIQPRPRVNHCLHFLITLFFFPWIIVWIILCINDG